MFRLMLMCFFLLYFIHSFMIHTHTLSQIDTTMPLHSIFILNPGGNVVFSKYFGFTNRKTTNAFKQEEKSLLFEQSVLYENTKATWTSPAISQRKLAFCDDGYIIVFQKIGELIVYVTGVEDYEEPICKFFSFLFVKNLTNVFIYSVLCFG